MMNKYAFLTEKEHINDNLGISDKRHEEIAKVCSIALIEGESNVSAAMEYAMNVIKPKDMVEAMYVGFMLKAKIDFQNPLFQLMMLAKQQSED